VDIELNQTNKRLVWEFWQDLEAAGHGGAFDVAAKAMHTDVEWNGPDPIGRLHGVKAFASDFWESLLQSFPDMTRQTHIFFGGESNGRIDGDSSLDGHMWVTGTGLMTGTFVNDYLTIPATGDQITIPWGEFCRLADGAIAEVYFLIDLVELMRQAGYEVLPPNRGADGIYLPAAATGGISLGIQNQEATHRTLRHIRRFLFDGLNAYDQTGLKSMGMADFFDPEVRWYGPGGIGASLSLKEFEDFHQRPWLTAFPDRRVQNLDSLFAEGAYSGASGWAGVKATHTGPYLELPATGTKVEFNGLDWWKRPAAARVDRGIHREMYVENWVFVDMVHLFRQLGIDLFERLAEHSQSG
jgi:predicted ester cyclase